MQPGQEHVHAEEGEQGDKQPDHGPPRQHGAAQAFDQADVQPGGAGAADMRWRWL